MDQTPHWTAIFASFGSIDKSLHMLAEHETPTKEKWALDAKMDLKSVLEIADAQLGKILTSLQEKNQLKETLIVVTADHGGQENKFFHGINNPGPGMSGFEYGKGPNFDNDRLPPSLKKLQNTGLIQAATLGSYLSFWLKKQDKISIARFGDLARSVPGVAEVYTRHDTKETVHYVRTFRNTELKDGPLDWAKKYDQDLMETMARDGSPDVVVLLQDGHGYAVKGDHGGAQEKVQRIPLIIVSPDLKLRGTTSEMPARLVDINPIVTRIMHLKKPEGALDGSASVIEEFLPAN
jgi:arylsulfatase A-like enzyme